MLSACVILIAYRISARKGSSLETLPGPSFEGLSLAAPFQDGAHGSRMIEMVAKYGPVISFKRWFSVRV
jgi:hypothetical protein